jgi:serine-type D-Ala-D-Ala carboxypeptidase (penicillin-binding protein 5/6)
MKKSFAFLLVSLALALFLPWLPALAQTPTLPTLPTPGATGAASLGLIPQPPSDITAKSYILIDFDSGLPIAALEPDVEREPASLTKLMTAYVVFGEIKSGKINLDDKVTISERAWRTGMQGASRMFIEVGEQVRVEDLLRGMIVQSGNDASTALARTRGRFRRGLRGSDERPGPGPGDEPVLLHQPARLTQR